MTDTAPPLHYRDADILGILQSVRRIALVGASPNWRRPSYFVMKYFLGKGYDVLPVNARAAGQEILGQQCHGSLAETPGPYEMVDIFRNSEAAGQITDEAIELAPEKGIKVVWMQLGVRNDAAAERARAAGLQVVMDRCPKIEFGRLHAELSWGGFNSQIVSSRRRRLRLS
jgi:predicted CoA-binding protein